MIGTLATPVRAAPSTLRDLATAIEVTLANPAMTLASADDTALDTGANLALLGDELIQFGRATQLTADRWQLSRLLRGRRGTEAAAGAQAAGDRFVLIEREALATVLVPVSAIGTVVTVLASGVGDVAGPAGSDVLVRGASISPPSPVHLMAIREAGNVRLRWARRSRSGWRWADGGDAPLSEESESYRLTIIPPGGTARTMLVTASEQRLTDVAAGTVLSVRQLGNGGDSPPATIMID